MLGYRPYFVIRHDYDGRAAPAPLYSTEIPCYSFLLEAEWTPGLMNADTRIRSPKNL
jgi:hypothetical protein